MKLELGEDAKKQGGKKILVYSRKQKTRHKKNLTLEAPRKSKPMIVPLEPIKVLKSHDTTNILESSDINLPFALLKKFDHVLSIISQSSCRIMLYLQDFEVSPPILTVPKSQEIFGKLREFYNGEKW